MQIGRHHIVDASSEEEVCTLARYIAVIVQLMTISFVFSYSLSTKWIGKGIIFMYVCLLVDSYLRHICCVDRFCFSRSTFVAKYDFQQNSGCQLATVLTFRTFCNWQQTFVHLWWRFAFSECFLVHFSYCLVKYWKKNIMLVNSVMTFQQCTSVVTCQS